jgi:hypothetical protein
MDPFGEQKGLSYLKEKLWKWILSTGNIFGNSNRPCMKEIASSVPNFFVGVGVLFGSVESMTVCIKISE